MLSWLLAGLAILVVIALIALAIRIVIRLVQALPQALVGGALGVAAALPLGFEPAGAGAVGAALGLAHGLRSHGRRGKLVTPEAPPVIAPVQPPPPPAPTPEPEPVRDPTLATAWDRVVEAAPGSRGRVLAARAGCELLLDEVDAGRADEAADEWASIVRSRVPELIGSGLALADRLDGRARDDALQELIATLERVADEADERRAQIGRAAKDAFDTMRRYFDERTRPDRFGPERA